MSILDLSEKVWIDPEWEPKWFGLWHRNVWYVRTRFMSQKFYDRAEAEEFAALLSEHML